MKRIPSIDIARGIVMIIMALDHIRDLMHVNSLSESPTDLATTTPILFFTRWITHCCAPTFVFLAGTAAYISLQNKPAVKLAKKALIKRGLGLILLEFTVVNLGIWFDVGFHNILFQVIAVIGIGFVVLGLLLKVPVKIIGTIGIVILLTHNLFSLLLFKDGSIIKAVLTPFFAPVVLPLFPQHVLIIAYPPIPWAALLLVGFVAGKLFELPSAERAKRLLNMGISFLLLFIFLRYFNLYGDPVPWSVQKNWTYDFLSFMNVTKYPPSLLFCLVTIGILFIFLAAAESWNNGIAKILALYGKVPLFYYLLHWYFIHIILLIQLLAEGFSWRQFSFATGRFGRPENLPGGVSLLSVYLIWIAVVVALYFPCRWYNKHYKKIK